MSDRWSAVNWDAAYGGQVIVATGTGDGSQRMGHAFTLSEAKTLKLWARGWAVDGSRDAFYAGVNGVMTRKTFPSGGELSWVEVGTYELPAGTHTLHLGAAEVGTYVDILVLAEESVSVGQLDARLGGAPPTSPLPGAGDPPPPSGGGAGVFDLNVNPAFGEGTGKSRVLKDGTAFNATMNQIYDGVLYYLNNSYLRSGSVAELRIEGRLSEGNSYQVGRNVFRQVQCLLLFFRLTGDIRILDELTRLSKVGYSAMRTTWASDSPVWSSSHPQHRQPHGERFFQSRVSPNTDRHWGTDDHLTDTVRSLRPFAQVAVAMRLNEALVSPGGHNYKAEADKWQAVFLGYEAVWSKVRDSSWPSNTRVPSVYSRGVWQPGGSTRRANLDEWPVNFRSLSHTTHGAALNSLYMGRLIGKTAVGLAGLKKVLDPFIEDEVLYTMVSGREHAFWGRSYGTWTSSSYYGHPNTYAEYTILDFLDLLLDNAVPTYDLIRVLAGAANSTAHWVINGSSASSFTLDADINGNADRTGTSESGRTATIETVLKHESFGPTYPDTNLRLWAHPIIADLDASGRLREFSETVWKGSTAHSANGTFSQPRSLAVPLGAFIDEANILANWPPEGGGGDSGGGDPGGGDPPPTGDPITLTITDPGTDHGYDGYVDHGTDSISISGTSYEIGQSSSKDREFWLVLPGLEVPQGATITEARVTLQHYYGYTGSDRFVTFDWQAVNADNASPPESYAAFNSLALATPAVRQTFPSPYAVNDVLNSADLTAVIQAIVNRPGWQPGNRIVLVGKHVSSSHAYVFRAVRPASSYTRTFTVKYLAP